MLGFHPLTALSIAQLQEIVLTAVQGFVRRYWHTNIHGLVITECTHRQMQAQ